jgi:uncharacterized ferritin-like protein (DUF455 family)
MDGGNKPIGQAYQLVESQITQHMFVIRHVGNNPKVALIKGIAHINFTALNALDLSDNYESIEGLLRVSMPHIK